MKTFENWARTHQCSPQEVLFPADEAEVAAAIQRARGLGVGVKAVGAAHSWSDVAMTDGLLVCLDRMNKVVEVDHGSCLVRVQAGIRLRELVTALEEHGLALCNMGSVSEQSIAGATSTGTHGSGIRFQNLPNMIVGLRIVDGHGEVHECTAQDDHFDALRLGLGLLGIITEVTLAVEPLYDLEEVSRSLNFEAALADMDLIIDASEHVKFWWLPHTDQVHVYSANRTWKPRTRPMLTQRLTATGLDRYLFDVVLAAGRRWPQRIPFLNNMIAGLYFLDYERVDRYNRVFNTPTPPVHFEAEYGVPRSKASALLAGLRDVIEREGIRVNFITEIRFTAADSLWLSPSYERQSCQLGAYIGNETYRRPYFEAFRELSLSLDGRPHWAKEFVHTPEELRSMFPRFDDFLKVRNTFDPDGVFDNDFSRRHFPRG